MSACFLGPFEVLFGTPKGSQNRAQEASKTPLEPGSAPRGSRDRFWTDFWSPRDLKTHDFTREGRQKSRFSCLASGQQNRAQNDTQMIPKSTPKQLPESQNVAQKRCWISGSILAPMLNLPKRPPKRHPKSLKIRPPRPRAAQRPPGTPPEAPREPF